MVFGAVVVFHLQMLFQILHTPGAAIPLRCGSNSSPGEGCVKLPTPWAQTTVKHLWVARRLMLKLQNYQHISM